MKRKLRYIAGLTMVLVAGGGGLGIVYISAKTIAGEIDRLADYVGRTR